MRRRSALTLLLALTSGCASSSATQEAKSPARTATDAPREIEAPGVIEASVQTLAGDLIAEMTPAVTSFGAASDGSWAYAIGGYHGEPHAYSREGQSRTLSRVSLRGGRWEVLTEMPHGLQGLAAVHVGGRICAFGGSRAENARGEATVMVSSDEAWCFEPESRAWSRLPPLPAGRSSHEAGVIGETVYLAGGWRLDGDPSEGEFHDTILALDLAADEPRWKTIEVPMRRRAVGVAALGGKLYVIGGITPEGTVSRRVDVFDPETGALARGPDFPEDAFGVAAERVGDAVVASARDGGLFRLAEGDGAWRRAASLALPRFFHQLVAAGDDAVLAIGGISGMHTFGRTRVVERVELGDARVSLGVVTVSGVGDAKNRQGVFVRGDHVYFFGGNVSLEQHAFEPRHFTDQGLRFHLPSLSFERASAYPARRQTMSTAVVGDVGIALGGFGHDGAAAVSHPEGYVYDFDEDRFDEGPSLPESRTQFGLAEHDGALYVFGGLNYDPARGEAAFEHVTSILRAPSPRGRFSELDVSLPGARRAFAGAVLDGKYYLVGGMKESFQAVDDCAVFAFETESFSAIRCPTPRVSGSLLAIGERLFLVGGSSVHGDTLAPARSIEMYDPAADTWTTVLEELPFETTHMRAFVHGERILLLSTHFEERRLRVAFVDVGRVAATR